MNAYSDLEHPFLQLWDTMYAEQKGLWTTKVTDEELLKLHDILTNGKPGLDILIPMHVWKITNLNYIHDWLCWYRVGRSCSEAVLQRK